jgi:hypothetical protein
MKKEKFKGGDGETIAALAKDAVVKPIDKNRAIATCPSPLLKALLLSKPLD